MDEAWRFLFPYCLQRVSDGRYIALNRLYKPLGVTSRDWVDYESQPSVVELKGLTEDVARRISHKGDPDLSCIYLYSDGCRPNRPEWWKPYAQRLELLGQLTVHAPAP